MKTKREKAFFGIMEFISGLLYVASSTLVFGVFAGLAHLKYPRYSPSIPAVILGFGIVLGCLWAWHIHKKYGTIEAVTGLTATPELDDMPDKSPRRPKD